LRRTLADLFARLVADALIFNPKVIYDQFRGVWLIAACARSFDAQRSTEHEMDELLGLGSKLGQNGIPLRPQDLFSWSSAGNRRGACSC